MTIITDADLSGGFEKANPSDQALSGVVNVVQKARQACERVTEQYKSLNNAADFIQETTQNSLQAGEITQNVADRRNAVLNQDIAASRAKMNKLCR